MCKCGRSRLFWRPVSNPPAELWPHTLRDALLAARKDRESTRELIKAEIDERLTVARDFTVGGHTERSATLRAEAAVLSDLLGDV
jgi:hypothetical protein